MFTLENRESIKEFYLKKRVRPYFFTMLFCIVFSFVYSQFSHGVTSFHMTYLFLYPLLLGVVVGLLFYYFEKESTDYFLAAHLYHTGVVALILSSLLKGIFDIAGTASIYQTALTILGVIMLICGIIVYVFCKIKQLIK